MNPSKMIVLLRTRAGHDHGGHASHTLNNSNRSLVRVSAVRVFVLSVIYL
jgi:hypothetical protein